MTSADNTTLFCFCLAMDHTIIQCTAVPRQMQFTLFDIHTENLLSLQPCTSLRHWGEQCGILPTYKIGSTPNTQQSIKSWNNRKIGLTKADYLPTSRWCAVTLPLAKRWHKSPAESNSRAFIPSIRLGTTSKRQSTSLTSRRRKKWVSKLYPRVYPALRGGRRKRHIQRAW